MSQQDNQFAIFHSFRKGDKKFSVGNHVQDLTWETMFGALTAFAGENLKRHNQKRRLSQAEVKVLEEIAGMSATQLIGDPVALERFQLKFLVKELFDKYIGPRLPGIKSSLSEKGSTQEILVDLDKDHRPIRLWVERIA